MLKALLVVTGIVNLLVGFFHLFLAYQIHIWIALPDQAHGMMLALNTGCTILVLFLAYACLVRGRDVMSTGLGGAVLALGALVYFSRAAGEFIWFNGNLAIFGGCLAAGLMHAVLLPFVRMARSEA